MPESSKQTQADRKSPRKAAAFRSGRQTAQTLVKLIADLIVERDRLAAEVARLTGKKTPPTFLQMVGR